MHILYVLKKYINYLINIINIIILRLKNYF